MTNCSAAGTSTCSSPWWRGCPAGPPSSSTDARWTSYYQEEAEKALRTARSFAQKQGWAVSSAHAAGHAAEEIAAYAKAKKPALIVMGTHGHSALGNAVLGSVTQGVLARCTVPLLLVH